MEDRGATRRQAAVARRAVRAIRPSWSWLAGVLRSFAIASNICFIAYGWAAQLLPVLILHCAILPVNIGYFFRELARRQDELTSLDAPKAPIVRAHSSSLGDDEVGEEGSSQRTLASLPSSRYLGSYRNRHRIAQLIAARSDQSALAQLGRVRRHHRQN